MLANSVSTRSAGLSADKLNYGKTSRRTFKPGRERLMRSCYLAVTMDPSPHPISQIRRSKGLKSGNQILIQRVLEEPHMLTATPTESSAELFPISEKQFSCELSTRRTGRLKFTKSEQAGRLCMKQATRKGALPSRRLSRGRLARASVKSASELAVACLIGRKMAAYTLSRSI